MQTKNIEHQAQRIITNEIFSAVETILLKHLLFAKEKHTQYLNGLIQDQMADESQKHLEEVQLICKAMHAKMLGKLCKTQAIATNAQPEGKGK